jgi:hypothetical protein
MIGADLERTLECCDRMVERSGLSWPDVDTVMLVGGSCRLPFVGERVQRAFGRPLERGVDSELAVCLGAARWADQRAGPPAPSREEQEAAAAEAERQMAEARAAAARRIAKREEQKEKQKRGTHGRLPINQAMIARTPLEQAWHPVQRDAIIARLTDTERLLWLFRCKRFQDTLREVAVVITTEQLICCREASFSRQQGSVRWADAYFANFSSDGFELKAKDQSRIVAFDGIRDGSGTDLRGLGEFTVTAVNEEIKQLVITTR